LSPSSSRIRNVFEPLPASEIAQLWLSCFGIPEDVFSGYKFFRKAKSIWAISDTALPRLSFESLGMRIMNIKDHPWKPTTCALQVFGKHATRNLVHLDERQARLFLEGGTQEIEPGPKSDSASESLDLKSDLASDLIIDSVSNLASRPGSGYVVVFYRGEVLGCGLYSHGKLVSQIPKERRATAGNPEGEEG
jgi:NOL1/NOP2/fmu family ribosome biogenesis protein